jgi:heme/copper-type cytochrome/quinol oxidase subunit 2
MHTAMDGSGSWADNAPDFGMSVLRIGALPPKSTRRSLMGVAIVLVLLVAASVLFHFLSPWYFTPIASNWGTIDDTISITFWVTGAVFVIVNLFMAYAVYRYRHRTGGRAHYEPENKKLEWWLLGLTTVGVAAMLAPGLFVWAKFVDVPKDAMVVEALGQQWHWMYRFPGKDGKPAPSARHRRREPAGIVPTTRRQTTLWSGPECLPRQADQGAVALDDVCTTSPCRSSGSRWIWCRDW